MCHIHIASSADCLKNFQIEFSNYKSNKNVFSDWERTYVLNYEKWATGHQWRNSQTSKNDIAINIREIICESANTSTIWKNNDLIVNLNKNYSRAIAWKMMISRCSLPNDFPIFIFSFMFFKHILRSDTKAREKRQNPQHTNRIDTNIVVDNTAAIDWIPIAIEYPIGVFQSNGNLLKEKNVKHLQRGNVLELKYSRRWIKQFKWIFLKIQPVVIVVRLQHNWDDKEWQINF